MRLDTERLVIRPFQTEDIQDVFKIFRDAGICELCRTQSFFCAFEF